MFITCCCLKHRKLLVDCEVKKQTVFYCSLQRFGPPLLYRCLQMWYADRRRFTSEKTNSTLVMKPTLRR
ncbi:hypothetical protein Hanom_Chr07g00619301 [Helianthus anomalus]